MKLHCAEGSWPQSNTKRTALSLLLASYIFIKTHLCNFSRPVPISPLQEVFSEFSVSIKLSCLCTFMKAA